MVKGAVSAHFLVGGATVGRRVVYELGELFVEYLEETLDDIADLVGPLRENGELKESPTYIYMYVQCTQGKEKGD